MKRLVFVYGRFNPPGIGHWKLFRAALGLKDAQSDFRVYPTHTQDSDKNPLSYSDKVRYLLKSFPVLKKYLMKSKAKTFLDVLREIHEDGYKNVKFVVGGDRVKEFQSMIDDYVNTEESDIKFDSIKIISAGKRDPDAPGISGMSSSKIRQAVRDSDMKSFRAGLSPKLTDKEIQDLYELLQKSLKEELINNDMEKENEVEEIDQELEFEETEEEKEQRLRRMKFKEWWIKVIDSADNL